MSEYTFNYIISIHNKENLIERVMLGVIKSCSQKSTIYPILDGCTDNTENIIDEIKKKFPQVNIKKLYAPDVHEIRSLNLALSSIPQTDKVLNITLQDDVILDDEKLEEKITKIYNFIGYEKIGTLSFRHGVSLRLDHKTKMVREMDLVESVYGVGMSNMPLPTNTVIERMVSIRSPECISSYVINKIGFLDEKLAPYMWDNHDLSIRCLEAGLRNFVFSLPFISDAKWGGMKTNPHPNLLEIDFRNRKYLYKKHYNFLSNPLLKKKFLKLRIQKPFLIPGISIDDAESKDKLKAYKQNRYQLIHSWRIYYVDYIKKHIRTMMYQIFSFYLLLSK
jgi:hypothetical protein